MFLRKFYDDGKDNSSGPSKQAEKTPTPVDGEKGKNFRQAKIDEAKSAGITDPQQPALDPRYSEEAHAKVRQFRTQVDTLFLTAKALNIHGHPFGIRELSLAITDFQSSRQFLGKVLKEIGATNPYPKTQAIPQADSGIAIDYSTMLNDEPLTDSAIKVLADLRDKAEEVIIDFQIYAEETEPVSWSEVNARAVVWQKLVSGKMWLGELLSYIAKK